MERLTTNKKVCDMSMLELAHNCCYIDENGNARYRDYEMDIDVRELTRILYKKYADEKLSENNDKFEEEIVDWFEYDIEDYVESLIALLYRNLWAMAELREKLKEYEDAGEPPCKVGDTIYTNVRVSGWYLGESNAPYEVKIAFIGINGTDNFVNVVYKNGSMFPFKWSDFGKTIFLTKEEAEQKLKELKREKHEQ